MVMKRALSEDGKTLYVMTFNEKSFMKQFALATVTYEDGFHARVKVVILKSKVLKNTIHWNRV